MKPPGKYAKLALIPLAVIAVIIGLNVVGRTPKSGPPTSLGPMTFPTPPLKQAGPAELALVAPLKKGGDLLDYEIKSISAVDNGMIWVIVKKGETLVYLTIALTAGGTTLAPYSVGPYGIFTSAVSPPPGEMEKLGNALLEVVKANAAVPPPPGLSTYTQGRVPDPPI
jgi:hypothetical protein